MTLNNDSFKKFRKFVKQMRNVNSISKKSKFPTTFTAYSCSGGSCGSSCASCDEEDGCSNCDDCSCDKEKAKKPNSETTQDDGCFCRRCNSFLPMVEPDNKQDGKTLCYNCANPWQ